MNQQILQMGNVVQNDPPIAKRPVEQAEQAVFNMRHAVFLSDTVDEKLAKAFLIQSRDPAFKGHFTTHIVPFFFSKPNVIFIRLMFLCSLIQTLLQDECRLWAI